MAMTISEADHVAHLVHFVMSGELYTGQPDPAHSAARSLEYLAGRAAKALQLNLPGDVEAYATRLQALAGGDDREEPR